MKETIIYIRTSTEEQNPENQLKDCKELAERLGIHDYEIKPEKKSAFKDNVERIVFNSIKTAIQEGKVKNLIVWDLDRLYRNRINTVDFIRNYAKLGLRVYSFRQSWFEDIKQIPTPFNEIVYDLMLQVISWIAEEESKKKSDRVRNAVRKDNNGKTVSYKGTSWGRKSIVTDKIKGQVKELHSKGKPIREIAETVYYYDENRNKKMISKSLVHKIILENSYVKIS